MTDAPVLIPLLIGVTGHRDLLKEETGAVRAAVQRFFTELKQRLPGAPLQVATALGPGADLLVAEEALGADIECIAVLPLPLELYRSDFSDPVDLKRFEDALSRCTQRIICPLSPGATRVTVAEHGPHRTAQYALAGKVIADDAFILLALWDGHPSQSAAGTAHTVEYRLTRGAWRDEATPAVREELLPNLPPDLVYQIVVSRGSGAPAEGLVPLQCGYRHGSEGPLESHLPVNAVLVAERTAELNRGLRRYAQLGHVAAEDLTADLATPPAAIVAAARLFGAIDWLAAQMRRNVMTTLIVGSVLTVLMGIFLVAYTHAEGCQPSCGPSVEGIDVFSISAFIAAFLILLAANGFARNRGWHRRYLEWRALAEGLRVQLFWTVAGVAAEGGTAALHRALLKQADPGLEWIPNAIRAVSLSLTEVRHGGIPGGVEFAIRRWVGGIGEEGSRSEQLHYYWHASRAKAAWASVAEGVAIASAAAGLVVALVLAAEEWFPHLVGLSKHTLYWLLFLIGSLPLFGAVLEGLVQKRAERELERQYSYMYAVFLAAHDRLMAAHTDEDRRAILGLLGRAALEENAAWLQLHRDRPIDRSRLQ